jgi:hypothetical protein
MNQKGFANIILVVVIVVLVGAVGYFALIRKPSPIAQQSPTPTPTSTQTKTPAPTPTPKDETANWKTYTNSRVDYSFKYPTANLTLALDETIKYPSTREGDSKTQDLVQFAVGETSFGIRTYVGAGKSTIESWIQEPNTPRAYHDLSKYEKITVGGKTAYQTTDEAFVYVLANGNIYEITGYGNIAPVKISAEPLFKKWVATIQFTK